MQENKLSGILKSVVKPGRYTGGEYNRIIKDKDSVDLRFAFCFPDIYDIGMSNLGVRILYDALNREDNIWCERAYAPWIDMSEKMREYNLPITAAESGDPLSSFDVVAFTLQYELCYTTALHMLKLSGIQLRSSERAEDAPIILGGGPCTYNAEPIADFFDVFSIGEGEYALVEFSKLYIKMKKEGTYTKKAFLHEVAKIEGFYVPSLYDVSYNGDGTVKAYTPIYDDIPTKIKKRIVEDLDASPYPEKLVMPFVETVHDRVVLEVYRGCIRGCRFCQAGMVYRPIREKSPETLCNQAKCLYENSGYDEISLCSLSISDYSRIDELTDGLLEWTEKENVNLSLPSLRVDSFTEELMNKISSVRMGGITFAPEAGTQRLRDAINKNVTEENLMRAVEIAFGAGKNGVKLYFMMGLPTEELSDVAGIADLAQKVVGKYYEVPKEKRGKGVSVTISVACFIPKPFTPFQWEAQDTLEQLEVKQQHLKECIIDRKVKYNYHDACVSRIEAVFARGNRTLSKALELACNEGVCFDAWDECFSYEKWLDIFERTGIDPAFFANRAFGLDEVLPWDIIDCGVTKEYLKKEREKAYLNKTTPSCAEHCNGCGANKLGGKNRWCK
ncbi:MAG: TIGR03960 family B12-binding radical SAM protein [Ruminococcaceae bacterium]|nr:TIGR03960 family B12-binding radical SAM protein [Oscillospiraceae bacterium]